MCSEKLDTRVRREQIAMAAMDLVASQGVRQLSMAAVARRVGLVPSGIYRHFRNKDEVLDAVLDLLQSRVQDNIARALEASDDPLEQLRLMLNGHMKIIRQGRAFPQIIFTDDLHGGHHGRRHRVQQILQQYLDKVVEIIRRGQADGQFRPDVDAATAGMLYFGMIVPAGIVWHLTDGGFDVTRHARRVWPLFRRALGAGDP